MSNTPTVWMNGELMPAEEVRVSPFDLGLTVGLGVFETMVAYDGCVFYYDRHHARLVQSASMMALTAPTMDVIEKAMSEVIAANDLLSGRSRIRVSISGGVNPLQGGDAPGNMIVTAVPQPEPADMAKLILGSYSCDESSAMSGVKSASYGCHVMTFRHAIAASADEALVLNSRGILCEGSMSNVFLVKDGEVRTPSLSSGCLAGVTRALVIELCNKLNIAIEETELGESDIQDADEIFLTSSAREVQAAKMLDSNDGNGVGPVTAQISSAYKTLIKQAIAISIGESKGIGK